MEHPLKARLEKVFKYHDKNVNETADNYGHKLLMNMLEQILYKPFLMDAILVHAKEEPSWNVIAQPNKPDKIVTENISADVAGKVADVYEMAVKNMLFSA